MIQEAGCTFNNTLSESSEIHKNEIISNLPVTLKEDLREYLDERGGGLSPEKTRGLAGGFVFEALVRADTSIFGQLETPAAAELRLAIHQHRKYGFDDPLLDAREPDMAIVHDDGTIAGYAEAKLGLLDDRCRRQLAASGAKASFLRFTRYLRENYEKLADWGLPALAAKNKKDIAVSKEGFERVLVVPADRGVESPESLISRRSDSGLSAASYLELKDILAHELRIVRSPFSLQEVWDMADVLVRE